MWPSTRGLMAFHCGALLLKKHSKKVRILHFLHVEKLRLLRRTIFQKCLLWGHGLVLERTHPDGSAGLGKSSTPAAAGPRPRLQ